MAADEQHDDIDETRTPLLPVVAAIAIALVLGLGLLAAVGGGGAVLPTGPTPAELAVETAEAWLGAWEAGAHDDMAALAGGSPGVAEAAAALEESLRLEAIEAAVVGRADVDDDTAAVPFEAELEIAGFGTWRYQGTVELVSPADGDWFVDWAPSVLHPALGEAGTLSLRVTWPQRAAITAADGAALPAPGVPALNGQVVGAVAPATPERAEELGPPYEAGQPVGVSGLQGAHEERLAGAPTGEILLEPGAQVLHAFTGDDPQPIRTTIDLRLQEAAESVVTSSGMRAGLVAVRPSSHEVVAVASAPVGGYPRALLGRYPPGSTFKVVTTTALLANGIIPDSPAPCPETAEIAGRAFRNAEGAALGDIDFRRAFYESCNTSFVQLADELAPDQLLAAAEAHGFNEELEALGLPAFGGSYPLPEGRIEQAASAIGQGRVLASPLQMALVAANVASGVHRPPRLVADGPPVAAAAPLPDGVAPTLQELMRLVVAQGTATRAQLPGEPVRGKTGTAEFGTERPPRTHAWFIGYRGDLAVAVVVEDAGFGGEVAAPLAREFLSRAG